MALKPFQLYHFDDHTIDNTVHINPAYVVTVREKLVHGSVPCTEVQIASGLLYMVAATGAQVVEALNAD